MHEMCSFFNVRQQNRKTFITEFDSSFQESDQCNTAILKS